MRFPSRTACAFILPLIAACDSGPFRARGSSSDVDTAPPVLLTDAQLARMHRIPIDTVPVHVEPPDDIIRGPVIRTVVTDSASLVAAWPLAGAHGDPPAVDFRDNALVLIGTAVHGGDWRVSVDGVYASSNRLYVVVHEHTECAPVDVYGRGTIALRIPTMLARYVNFIERPFDRCGDHEAW